MLFCSVAPRGLDLLDGRPGGMGSIDDRPGGLGFIDDHPQGLRLQFEEIAPGGSLLPLGAPQGDCLPSCAYWRFRRF